MDVTIYAFYWTKPKVAYVGMTSDVGKCWAEHLANLQLTMHAYNQCAYACYLTYGEPMFRKLCIVRDQAKAHTEQVKQAEQTAYERLHDAGWTMANVSEPRHTYGDSQYKPSERNRLLQKNIRCKFGTGKIYRYLESMQICNNRIEDWMHFVIDKADMALFYVWDTRQALFQIDANLLPKTYVRVIDDSFMPIIGLEQFQLTTITDDTRQKLSASHTGFRHSDETKQLMHIKQSQRTPDTCRKLSESHIGVKKAPMSEDAKRRIATSNKGKTRSAESRARMSAAQRNRSAEHRQHLSEARRAWWQRRKALAMTIE